eukprot:TRINITY_DN15560_c0_g1_i1.p1 TRINITY_DN15560_c0_g1~~TRINITY_DN15560_c0_g1_i1.p1  ORF type:complete len:128 (-),score=31.85 TRINITY_DN15560_c0_g1_i1:134-517(-)
MALKDRLKGTKINMWASRMGLCGCLFFIMGGIDNFFYPGGMWVGIYCEAVAFILIPLLWPFKKLGPVLKIFTWNYILSAVIMGAVSICAFLQPATVSGGVVMIFSGLLFLLAFFLGETHEEPRRGGE